MMPNLETPQDFVARHGGCPIKHGQRGDKLLPDGALISQGDFNPVLIKPPTDPVANLRARIVYHKGRVTLAERHFRELRDVLRGSRNAAGFVRSYSWQPQLFGADPGPDGPTALRRLQEIVFESREAVTALEKALDEIDPIRAERIIAERLQREVAAEQRERQSKIESEIVGITI